MEFYSDALASSPDDPPELLRNPLLGFRDALAAPEVEPGPGDALALPVAGPLAGVADPVDNGADADALPDLGTVLDIAGQVRLAAGSAPDLAAAEPASTVQLPAVPVIQPAQPMSQPVPRPVSRRPAADRPPPPPPRELAELAARFQRHRRRSPARPARPARPKSRWARYALLVFLVIEGIVLLVQYRPR